MTNLVKQDVSSSAPIVPIDELRQGFEGQALRLLTVEEVAQLLQVPTSWVYGKTRRRTMDRIPGFRLGKYWRFKETDVLAWIERQRTGVSNA